MRSRGVAGSGLRITELGFGGSVIGNLYRAITDDQAYACVDAAWSSGIRYFDTAPHYGLGLSERRLGTALAGRPRTEYVLSTKVGRRLVPNDRQTGRDGQGFDVVDDLKREWDFSRDGVLRSIEQSLDRLGTDRIDIVYIHDPDEHVAQALTAAAPALSQLRSEGVIGAWGVGMNRANIPARFVRETDIDVVMLAGRYTLLDQSAAIELLPACVQSGTAVVNVGVFNSGILSKSRPEPGVRFDYQAAPEALITKANAIADICHEFGITLPIAALAYSFRHPAVVSVAVGMRTPAQVASNIAMYRTRIPEAFWGELTRRELIPPLIATPAARPVSADLPTGSALGQFQGER